MKGLMFHIKIWFFKNIWCPMFKHNGVLRNAVTTFLPEDTVKVQVENIQCTRCLTWSSITKEIKVKVKRKPNPSIQRPVKKKRRR